ncbi:hypothetical protein Hanom_Chr05g00467361 [Helianthus anomalus]
MTLWYHFAPHVCNFLPFSSKWLTKLLYFWTKMAKSYKRGGQNGTKVSLFGRKWQKVTNVGGKMVPKCHFGLK